jgi:predicted dehydrogenase
MSIITKLSRRRFLQQSSKTAIGALAVPYFVPAAVLAAPGRPGANDRVVVGFIGTGGRARQLMDHLPAEGQIVAAADCYLQRVRDAMREKQGEWNLYQDYRKMFDAEKLDAVVVATPDHGRVLPCIRACQAGLDIYAEKPLTLTIAEGRVLVNAVRKYQRVFQVGSQQRTMEMNRFACDFVRGGGLGRLRAVLGINYPGPRRYAGLPEEPIPEGDDWDMWCGQTEKRPFNRQLQFAWMQWRSYSGGEMTNWGAHGLDQIQWALGMSHTGPVEIWPAGEGANATVRMRYSNDSVVRLELDNGPMGGAVFVGEDAKMEINRNKFTTNPPDLVKDGPEPAEAEIWEGPGWIARPHMQNWLDCIKTRERPNADVEIGHRSITVCHLANICREVGRRLRWDPDREIFPADAQANSYLDRPKRKGYELPEPV